MLTDADLRIVGVSPEGDSIIFEVALGETVEQFTCNTAGEYTSVESKFICRDGARATQLSEYFKENPIQFKASDDTVYYGHEVLKGNT